jgi:hypothetical protein
MVVMCTIFCNIKNVYVHFVHWSCLYLSYDATKSIIFELESFWVITHVNAKLKATCVASSLVIRRVNDINLVDINREDLRNMDL